MIGVPVPKGPQPLTPEQEATVRNRLERGEAVTVVAFRLGVRKSQVLAVRHKMKGMKPYKLMVGEHEEAHARPQFGEGA